MLVTQFPSTTTRSSLRLLSERSNPGYAVPFLPALRRGVSTQPRTYSRPWRSNTTKGDAQIAA